MKFSDFIIFDAINTDLAARNKVEAIREIVGSLQVTGAIEGSELDSIVQAIVNREELGSTGIGRGVGIPHVRYSKMDRVVGTVAVSRQGIDFDSLDGKKVKLILLMVLPPGNLCNNQRPLETVARHLRDNIFLHSLIEAKTPAEIRHLLEEADAKHVCIK
jgi:mannitol/fructose-specific phosphotransferase system IIA component (Ntr-type)